ncbi:MAG TPA: sensor histidine kinase [Nitrososphaeraceae archaeon]|nr:sensor histidine kinase [Nitrososphaeraceae archaeon]
MRVGKNRYTNPFTGKAKILAIIFIALIVGISYGLFFYLDNANEQDVRNRIFERKVADQIKATNALAGHIGTDLTLVVDNLRGLANSVYIQQGDVSSNTTRKLTEEAYNHLSNRENIIDRLVIVDKRGFETIGLVAKGQRSFAGTNVSSRPWVQETLTSRTPTLSNGFAGLDGNYRIAIGYPITNLQTGQYMGLIGALIPFETFLSQHGNIHNVNSEFLVAYDKNATILATASSKDLIGKNFFGGYVQQFIKYNEVLNNFTRNMLAGRPGYAIYNYGAGERLITGYPIYVNSKVAYFVNIVTPTSLIYSRINDVLFTERVKMFSLLAGTTAAVVILIVFLIKWSVLNEEVKRRGRDLEEANKELEAANEQLLLSNEQLKIHDRMQRDFINIAAHELRTPIQPLLFGSESLKRKNPGEFEAEIVYRNAKKLQTLANNLLDVSRIENGTLKLYKDRLNIKDIILDALEVTNVNLSISLSSNKKENGLKIIYEPENLFIDADKDRIIQVVSNLLINAAKSITQREEEENLKEAKENGVISVFTQKRAQEDSNEVVVSIHDHGKGIDPQVMPRLFSKFATKSFDGTGLGLYISKSIIEAHGGKIWAGNNKNGKGATFSFSLPLADNNKTSGSRDN